MAYLIVKVALIALAFASAFSQGLPNDGYGNYTGQTCCPEGYNVAGIYCVKCNAPKHWDAASQRCVSCQAGHAWDAALHQCSCCDLPRQIIGADCVCPPPKTQWNNSTKTCSCPPNTYGDQCQPCPAPRQWNYQTNTCDCPPPTTVWNGAQCVCPAGRYGPNCV